MAVNVTKWLGSNAADAIIRIIILLSMTVSLVLFFRQDALASCQARYDQSYAIYAKQTRENQNEVNDARDTFFKAFHEALLRRDQQTLNDVNKAFDDYFATVQSFKDRQAANPPPDLPEKTCGTP